MPCIGSTPDLPMEVKGEAAGGRAVVAHVGCCVLLYVFCVLCCVVSATFSYQRYLLCRKLDIKLAKMADLCTLIDNDVPKEMQNIKWLQNRNRNHSQTLKPF